MANSFSQQLNDIHTFYKTGEKLFSIQVNHPIIPQNQGPSPVQTFSPTFQFLFRNTIPIMLCSAWESFRIDLIKTDLPRYQKHFSINTKWYNDSIKDISEIRHCIAHDNGILDQNRLNKIKTNAIYKVGEIRLEATTIDDYFQAFVSAYSVITA